MTVELLSRDLVRTVDSIRLPSAPHPVEGRAARQDAYTIHVTTSLRDTAERLIELVRGAKVAILTDRNVMDLYGPTLVRALESAGIQPEVAVIPPGERHKTLGQASDLLDWLTGTQTPLTPAEWSCASTAASCRGRVARMRRLVALAVVLGSLAVATSASAAVSFHSPSGNIRCVIAAKTFTRCDITRRDWRPPPKPRTCEFDWGNTLEVGLRGRGKFGCVSDAIDPGPVLAYGEAITRGRFRCRSRRSGMRCVNTRTDHGFALSRQRVRRF